jgi:hypothetical protein
MFQWMEILAPGPVAKAILAVSIVAAAGLALGSLGIRGIRNIGTLHDYFESKDAINLRRGRN